MSDMKCPICGNDLEQYHTGLVCYRHCLNGKNVWGSEETLKELERTRKALDVAKNALNDVIGCEEYGIRFTAKNAKKTARPNQNSTGTKGCKMTFDGEPEIVNGQHKYWKPMKYKGYAIVPYEGPVGRMFLVANPKERQWIYSSEKLEDCGAHIDMLVIADKFNKNKKRRK